jgi:hypothetical protein
MFRLDQIIFDNLFFHLRPRFCSLNFISQFHDDREIATAANQTLAHLRPPMAPPPTGEISEISGFPFSSATTLPPPSLVYLLAHF